MIEITTIAAAVASTAAPTAAPTAADTVAAPTPAPTAADTVAPTPAPTAADTVAPTPAPERRLASGDMTVTARFTGVPDTVTKDIIESKASDIQAAINTRLTGITISGLSVIATDTPAPTPSDAGAGSGAFGARLDVSAAAVLLALLCRG